MGQLPRACSPAGICGLLRLRGGGWLRRATAPAWARRVRPGGPAARCATAVAAGKPGHHPNKPVDERPVRGPTDRQPLWPGWGVSWSSCTPARPLLRQPCHPRLSERLPAGPRRPARTTTSTRTCCALCQGARWSRCTHQQQRRPCTPGEQQQMRQGRQGARQLHGPTAASSPWQPQDTRLIWTATCLVTQASPRGVGQPQQRGHGGARSAPPLGQAGAGVACCWASATGAGCAGHAARSPRPCQLVSWHDASLSDPRVLPAAGAGPGCGAAPGGCAVHPGGLVAPSEQ
jgi:hypothetical protein